jgi:hypothetical protein
MNKLVKMTVKLISVSQILAVALLSACTPLNAPSTVCHATGDVANPYVEIAVNSAELNEHRGHPNDINPVPVGGCPSSPVVIIEGKITICHATSSEKNPYNQITISVNGLNGHDKHEGDIIPMPQEGCPTTKP